METNSFIAGVVEFYKSLNPIDWEKQVNWSVDNNKVRFNFIVKDYLTRNGQEETPNAEWDYIEFTFTDNRDLMEWTVSTLDRINELEIETK